MTTKSHDQETIWEFRIQVPARDEERFSQAIEFGTGIAPACYAPAEKKHVELKLFIPERNRREIGGKLRGILKSHRQASIRTTKVPPEDWRESWKKHFPPFEVGSRLLIRPSFSKKKPKVGQRVVILDPGLSFGTGQHPTTRFCLEEIEKLSRDINLKIQDEGFLDLGTGSGILAIAAAKLGFKPILAVDYDPVCVQVSKKNAVRNKVADKIRFQEADVTRFRTGKRFGLIAANLIYDVLLLSARKVRDFGSQDAHLLLAGILSTQFRKVQRQFEKQGWKLIDSKEENEWTSGHFVLINRRHRSL